jgi:hypothetical protein
VQNPVHGYTNDTSLLYRAEDELRQASRIDPDLLSLPAADAAVYLAQGRKELIPWDRLEWAIQQDKSNVNNRLWRGIALWLSGDPASASSGSSAPCAMATSTPTGSVEARASRRSATIRASHESSRRWKLAGIGG